LFSIDIRLLNLDTNGVRAIIRGFRGYGVIYEVGSENGVLMSQDLLDSYHDLTAAAVVDERDPEKITALIEQLDRDLAETQKSASNRR